MATEVVPVATVVVPVATVEQKILLQVKTLTQRDRVKINEEIIQLPHKTHQHQQQRYQQHQQRHQQRYQQRHQQHQQRHQQRYQRQRQQQMQPILALVQAHKIKQSQNQPQQKHKTKTFLAQMQTTPQAPLETQYGHGQELNNLLKEHRH